MHRPAFTLLFLAFLAFFLGLGRMPVTDADEAFYARASWEMVERGDWLTPRFNAEDRWQKPVLYYWLTATVYLLTGPTEWSARIWSALAGLGLVFLTWSMATRLTGRADAAWLSGAIVATCFGSVSIGRMALPDLPLAFCITLGIWAAWRATAPGEGAATDGVSGGSPRLPRAPDARATPGLEKTATAVVPRVAPARVSSEDLAERRRWWRLGGLAAGLGFLMKGPVALVIPALVLLPLWWRVRGAVVRDARGLLTAVIVALVVALPWYVAMWLEHGTAYVQSFFVGDNLERFATDRYNEPRGLFYYVPVLVGGVAPWSWFLLVLPWRRAGSWLRGRRLNTTEWLLLVWVVMPVLFYSLSIGKQPRYILPVLPPVAMLMAWALVRRLDEARTAASPVLAIGGWGTAVLLAAAAGVLARTQPLFIDAHPWATWMAVGALAALATTVAGVTVSRSWERLPGVLAMAAALLLVSIQFGALTGLRPAPVETMAARIQEHRHRAEPIGTYQVFVRNLIFYTGARQEVVADDEAAVDFLRSPERVLLVVREPDLMRLRARLDAPLPPLASVRYVDTARIRVGTLLGADPARHVETIVLVSNR